LFVANTTVVGKAADVLFKTGKEILKGFRVVLKTQTPKKKKLISCRVLL
jgi:hypothetical protein